MYQISRMYSLAKDFLQSEDTHGNIDDETNTKTYCSEGLSDSIDVNNSVGDSHSRENPE